LAVKLWDEILGDILGDINEMGVSHIRETPLFIGSAGKTRTYNPSVNSRFLHVKYTNRR